MLKLTKPAMENLSSHLSNPNYFPVSFLEASRDVSLTSFATSQRKHAAFRGHRVGLGPLERSSLYVKVNLVEMLITCATPPHSGPR